MNSELVKEFNNAKNNEYKLIIQEYTRIIDEGTLDQLMRFKEKFSRELNAIELDCEKSKIYK